MSVQKRDFVGFPVREVSDPLVLLKKLLSFDQNFLFFLGLLSINPFDDLFGIFEPIIDILKIFQNQFGVDNFHISDRVDIVLSVSHFRVFEGSNHVVDPINLFDVTEEVVSESLAVRGSFHQTSNINNR
jgi:hypothetical protein